MYVKKGSATEERETNKNKQKTEERNVKRPWGEKASASLQAARVKAATGIDRSSLTISLLFSHRITRRGGSPFLASLPPSPLTYE